MYHAGGPIAWFGRWKTVPPVAFHRADIQPVEGVMDVSRGDVFAGTPGLPGGGDERQGGLAVFGVHRDTVRKMLSNAMPQGYTRKRPPRLPKLEPYTGVIDAILEADQRVPRKQRHTVEAHFRAAAGRIRVRRSAHHSEGLRTGASRAVPGRCSCR